MELHILVIAAGAVLAAAVIRGYSGFGFSMITVISLSQVFPPVEVVPVILLLEVLASLWLLPNVWRRVHWPSLTWLFVGVVIGTPIGVNLLAQIPARPMRIAIALVVIILVICFWRGVAFQRMPGRAQTTTVGMVSGVLNGATTVGGPPVILFYFSTPAGVAVSRASLIAYFLATDIFAFGVSFLQGLVTTTTMRLAGMLALPLLVGLMLGSRFFHQSKADAFRRKVLLLLSLLATMALLRAIWW